MSTPIHLFLNHLKYVAYVLSFFALNRNRPVLFEMVRASLGQSKRMRDSMRDTYSSATTKKDHMMSS